MDYIENALELDASLADDASATQYQVEVDGGPVSAVGADGDAATSNSASTQAPAGSDLVPEPTITKLQQPQQSPPTKAPSSNTQAKRQSGRTSTAADAAPATVPATAAAAAAVASLMHQQLPAVQSQLDAAAPSPELQLGDAPPARSVRVMQAHVTRVRARWSLHTGVPASGLLAPSRLLREVDPLPLPGIFSALPQSPLTVLLDKARGALVADCTAVSSTWDGARGAASMRTEGATASVGAAQRGDANFNLSTSNDAQPGAVRTLPEQQQSNAAASVAASAKSSALIPNATPVNNNNITSYRPSSSLRELKPLIFGAHTTAAAPVAPTAIVDPHHSSAAAISTFVLTNPIIADVHASAASSSQLSSTATAAAAAGLVGTAAHQRQFVRATGVCVPTPLSAIALREGALLQLGSAAFVNTAAQRGKHGYAAAGSSCSSSSSSSVGGAACEGGADNNYEPGSAFDPAAELQLASGSCLGPTLSDDDLLTLVLGDERIYRPLGFTPAAAAPAGPSSSSRSATERVGCTPAVAAPVAPTSSADTVGRRGSTSSGFVPRFRSGEVNPLVSLPLPQQQQQHDQLQQQRPKPPTAPPAYLVEVGSADTSTATGAAVPCASVDAPTYPTVCAPLMQSALLMPCSGTADELCGSDAAASASASTPAGGRSSSGTCTPGGTVSAAAAAAASDVLSTLTAAVSRALSIGGDFQPESGERRSSTVSPPSAQVEVPAGTATAPASNPVAPTAAGATKTGNAAVLSQTIPSTSNAPHRVSSTSLKTSLPSPPPTTSTSATLRYEALGCAGLRTAGSSVLPFPRSARHIPLLRPQGAEHLLGATEHRTRAGTSSERPLDADDVADAEAWPPSSETDVLVQVLGQLRRIRGV